jgi:hypothetical protein
MPVNLQTRSLRLFTALLPLTVLAGCGGGSGPEPIPGRPQPIQTGVLLDSPVSGVSWETAGGSSGLTNAQGEFTYRQPESGSFTETVTFSVGDIVLGTGAGSAPT